ncbi:MAG TPA: MinD/ParA family protein [Firmicutes bacterium]|nr:MinD/ParA family protein [Bacillota bacterium]
MDDRIRVLLASTTPEILESIRASLAAEDGFRVVGEARSREEARRLAERFEPDVVLIDLDPWKMNWIDVVEHIVLSLPEVTVIVFSNHAEPEYLRDAMVAGAREYLVKPFGPGELLSAIRRAYEADKRRRSGYAERGLADSQDSPTKQRGKIITFLSTKGGVGKTTIATNFAVQLVRETKGRVVMVDLDLEFGDVAILLDILPTRTMVDLVQEESLTGALIERCLSTHRSGLKVLAAPTRPEQAELVEPEHVHEVLALLRGMFDYIVVDTAQSFTDTVLSALDISDMILLVTTLEVPAIKNTKLCLGLMDSLHYPAQKIKILVNRSSREIGVNLEETERTLGRPVDFHIPSEGRLIVPSVNRGVPFIMTNSSSRAARSLRDVVKSVLNEFNEHDANEG